MPFSSSNLPSKIFYSAIGAEVLRIGRATSLPEDFLKSSSSLLKRMFKQGAKKHRLQKTLQKMYGRHHILNNFASNAKAFVDVLLAGH